MVILEYLETLFKGRGFFAPFLVVTGWIFVVILIFVILIQLLLYALRIKYNKH
jgi:hypothetical protein